MVGRVGPDMHEYDLAWCRCLQDSFDDGVHALAARGSLPAEAVDGPANGDVAESADYFQVVRAQVAEREAEELRIWVGVGSRRSRRPQGRIRTPLPVEYGSFQAIRSRLFGCGALAADVRSCPSPTRVCSRV